MLLIFDAHYPVWCDVIILRRPGVMGSHCPKLGWNSWETINCAHWMVDMLDTYCPRLLWCGHFTQGLGETIGSPQSVVKEKKGNCHQFATVSFLSWQQKDESLSFWSLKQKFVIVHTDVFISPESKSVHFLSFLQREKQTFAPWWSCLTTEISPSCPEPPTLLLTINTMLSSSGAFQTHTCCRSPEHTRLRWQLVCGAECQRFVTTQLIQTKWHWWHQQWHFVPSQQVMS